MKYRITHKTAYHYSEPVSLSQNELYLTPRPTIVQRVEKSRTIIVPEPQYLQQRTDYYGNSVQVFMVQHPHDELVVEAVSEVVTSAPVMPDPAATPPWESAVRRLAHHTDPVDLEAFQFVFASPLISIPPGIREYAVASFAAETPVLSGSMDLMGRIFTDFAYEKEATTIDTEVADVFSRRKGVCQDFAHLFISCLRSLGLSARYVSGYLETRPPAGKSKLVGADASHAWISVYVPDTGWVDLDPTNNLLPAENHVTLAWGRDYGDVTPVKGVVMGGGAHTLSVMVDVAVLD